MNRMDNKQFAISAGHEETLACAQSILEAGGNAFDASISAAFSMFITETCMSSAGAGGFAMVHSKDKGTRMLDFFTQTPITKRALEQRDFYPVEVNFGNETEEFHVGLASVATPGIVKGLFKLHKEYGSMPMSDLLFPVKELAKNGVKVNEFQHIDIGLLGVILAEDPSVKSVFFDEKGERLQVGDNMYMPNFSGFLDLLEYEGEKEFYHGEISRIVDKASRERGGYIRREDFEKYDAYWRKAIQLDAFSHKIFMPNGPSLGGGIMALLLQDFEKSRSWIKSVINIKHRYNDIRNVQEALDNIMPELGYNSLEGPLSTKGTSHFNIVDKDENVVSFSCSIGEGSGYFIPGTDMQLNNMLGESFLLPDGFHSWKENSRLHSMMTPTLVFDKEDQFKFSGGSGGAGRIPYMIAQVITQLLEEGKSLREAIEYPRAYLMGNVMHTEANHPIGDLPGTLQHKEWDYLSLFYGGVHGISKKKDGRLEAFGDPRRYGVGVVNDL